LLHQVSPGGALAVQMPAVLQSPLDRVVVEVADLPEWCEQLVEARKALTMHRPDFYYDILQPFAGRLDLWETEYNHVLAGPEAVLSWVKGTRLRPYLEALREDQRPVFEEQLLGRLRQGYPGRVDGRVLLAFRRLFLVAYRRRT
jgi:trans-aconitate 2-methyltransferase